LSEAKSRPERRERKEKGESQKPERAIPNPQSAIPNPQSEIILLRSIKVFEKLTQILSLVGLDFLFFNICLYFGLIPEECEEVFF